MTETGLSRSPLAPAIENVPPYDRGRARAAAAPSRRPSAISGDTASETRPRPPFENIALVLQGGGALGAYQAALASAKLRPVGSPTRESRRVYVSAVLIYRRGYVSKVADTASACEALSITRASLPSTPSVTAANRGM